MEVIIPATPVVHPCTNEKVDIMETPSSPDILQNPPPPPYSQWDVEQLIEKSKEVLTGHSEYLASGGEKKEKEMLDKITQVESLLQTILSDQTFAMHHLRSQLSDIQTVLKKMHKQEAVTNEEIQKLTENLVTSDTVNFQFDACRDETGVTSEAQDTKVVEERSARHPLCEEINIINPTPALSAILMAPPTLNVPTLNVSRKTSRAPSNASSMVPSRTPSPPPSKFSSRAVSPIRENIEPNNFSSNLEPESLPVIRSLKSLEVPKLDESLGDNDDNEEDETHNTSLDGMINLLSKLINEATEAVDKPIVGREDLSKIPTLNYSDIDISDITDGLNALEEEEESSDDLEEGEGGRGGSRHENPERGRGIKRDKTHKRAMSRNEENFEDGMDKFTKNIEVFSTLFGDLTEPIDNEMQDDYLQYENSTEDLIRNPSGNLADLDDFSQQCRLLTRALILPFLRATHSFMSESLKTSIHSREATSTTRTFMNLIYWTFLFTLGSLVLDAWLCEVAGRQVIRVVESLKPVPLETIVNVYNNTHDVDQQDGGMGVLEDGKKKNVKFRTGLKLKAVTWRGAENGTIGGGGWLRDGVMSLRRKGGRLLTSGGKWSGSRLFSKMTVGKFEEEFSEDSDEWEIVDFDSSEGEESGAEEDDIEEEDPVLSLKRKITNEWMRRAGHVNKSILEEASKMEEEKNNVNKNDVSFIEDDIQTFGEITTTTTTLKTFVEEPEEYDMDEDEDENDVDEICDLNIPGSFPAAFKWTPSRSVVDLTESVQRVRSVVLRRPKRNGPFGGSGAFWIMKTRKINRHMTDMDVSSAVLKRSGSKLSPIARKKSSKSQSIPKRIRIRRNSI